MFFSRLVQKTLVSKIRCPSYLAKCTKRGLYTRTDFPHTFNKILIANRGEIACRIIKTCRTLGIKTVAVYSDADRNSMFVHMADEAYRIGPPSPLESYLQIDKIIEIAKLSKAEAVHPGYGFLSENPKFAENCFKNGIEFIGPPVQAMKDMGSKAAAKQIMQKAGVPVVPGYYGEDQSIERFKKEASKMGYPVMLKAVSGGGGKGIRPVFEESELAEKFMITKEESKKAFNNEYLLVEKFVSRARHIEFQVFADKHHNAIHLFERDCSVQRDNQKVFEESPAPGMTDKLRNIMGTSAVNAALAVNYVGAGTVEFLVNPDTMDYYFMEMNTRLQVEHPVTEMLVNKDLVQLQLHVAAGHKLPYQQSDINSNGRHVIEARIYAEDSVNFTASTGKLYHLSFPNNSTSNSNIRIDTGVRENDKVTPYYDAMIAKLIVCSNSSRKDAIEKMDNCLKKIEVSGLQTNIEFLKRVLNHKEFIKGGVVTNFIKTYKSELLVNITPNSTALALAGIASIIQRRKLMEKIATNNNIWLKDNMTGFRINNMSDNEHEKVNLISKTPDGDITESVQITWNNYNNGCVVKSGNVTLDIKSFKLNNKNELEIITPDQVLRINISFYNNNNITLFYNGMRYDYTLSNIQLQYPPEFERTLQGIVMQDMSQRGNPVILIKSPMPSTIENLNVKINDKVKKGDLLLITSAMKMRHDVKAITDGIVEDILCTKGDNVEQNQVLMKIKNIQA